MNILALVLSLSFSPSLSWAADTHLKEIDCKKEVVSLLDQWEGQRDWRRMIDTAEGAHVFQTPTTEPGIWIETRIYSDSNVEALRVTPRSTTKIVWKDTCTPQLSIFERHYDEKKMSKAFTDKVLKRLLGKRGAGNSGLLYAWSPHMPFSVRGLKEAAAAAKQLGVKLTVVLDPHADSEEARRIQAENRIPAEAMRRIESIELFRRSVLNHYPAVVMYSNGKIVGPTIPGYKQADFYERFFREYAQQ